VSLRDDALATLEAWEPPNHAQGALRTRYVEHLVEHPDGVWRACLPDHLTASTLVLSDDGAQVLLTLHAKARRWFQFGGHLEPGDATLVDAARREVGEESGLVGLGMSPAPIQLSEHAVPFCGPRGLPRPVHHLDVRFLAVAPRDATHAVSDESLDVRWWPWDGLPDPEPDLVELVALGRAALGQ
jgi:8-oxo-dGTP pyrophosphatase MutT (NUDIX family)